MCSLMTTTNPITVMTGAQLSAIMIGYKVISLIFICLLVTVTTPAIYYTAELIITGMNEWSMDKLNL